jgi:hypothetical protein
MPIPRLQTPSVWIKAVVECASDRIAVSIDRLQATSLTDDSFADGQAGMAFFGIVRAIFRDLLVEARAGRE